ncbi:MAG: GGDEF domain-containing protein [Candidatus ainarchaeum sp.]|nr:GGDEF domain-containing protein [Candidatus ainarchaeum sp.]
MQRQSNLDRRKGRPSFGRRQLGRSISPQQVISGFDMADRQMRAQMRAVNAFKSRLGIKNITDANLARLKNRRGISAGRMRSLNEILRIKPEYVSSLRESARARRLIKLGLVRDPKFVQIENLAAFTHNVFQIMRSCEASGRQYSMAILDIDKFKRINDSFGHGVGDVVISEMASMLSAFAKKHGGAAARVGGEEFRVFVAMSPKELRTRIVELQKTFSDALEKPERRGAQPINSWQNWTAPTFSAGISAKKGNKKTLLNNVLNRLSTESDSALYKAKETRNTVAVFVKP